MKRRKERVNEGIKKVERNQILDRSREIDQKKKKKRGKRRGKKKFDKERNKEQ